MAGPGPGRGTTAGPAEGGLGRFALAAPKRRTMGRFTRWGSFRIDLPTSLEGVDRAGAVDRGLVPAGGTDRRVGPDRLGAPDRRRDILPGEKGGECVGVGRKGNGTTALVLMDGNRTPIGVVIAPANEHEVRYIERLLDSVVVDLPKSCRLLYDGAADSDPLRERLARRGVELISPHRKGRVKPPTQDGRKLRRKRHCWRLGRANAWLQNYGRIAVRKDRLGSIFLGWTQLAYLFTILRTF